jgi:hypothetical protein
LLHHEKGALFAATIILHGEADLIIHLNWATFVVSSSELNYKRTVSGRSNSHTVVEVVSKESQRKSVDEKIIRLRGCAPKIECDSPCVELQREVAISGLREITGEVHPLRFDSGHDIRI